MSPWEASLTLQLAMCEGWAKMIVDAAGAYDRLIAHQAQFFGHPPVLRFRDVSPCGADWFDHYGHRAHDVDVERV